MAKIAPLSVNSTQVPQTPDIVALFTLIGTWALVAVATITILVTAWQTRKGQRLLNKQVEESIAQTTLQQQQFVEMREEQERPRVEELIRRVITTAIQLLDSNGQARIRHYLAEENILHDFLVGSSDPATRLAFEGFKKDYPELAKKIKAYDELSIDLRNLRLKLQKVLASSVEKVIPHAVRAIPPDWIATGVPQADAMNIAGLGILASLQGKTPSISGFEGMLWEKADKLFIVLADEPEAKNVIDELRRLAKRSYEDGLELARELGDLRESLGNKYKIPRRDYFPSAPPILLTP